MESTTVVVPWKPLHIIPIGDIQWAGKDHYSVSLSALREMVAKGLEYERLGHTVKFLGMGDYIDYLSPSNRTKVDAAGLYDTAIDILDKVAFHLNDELVKEALKPTIGKWVGLIEGHHFKNLTTGSTSDMELCKLLKARFLGTSAVIRFKVQRSYGTNIHQQHHTNFIIWAHHGVGGGQTGYYPLLRLEKTSAKNEGIHAFLMGHTCKQAIESENKLEYHWPHGKLDAEHRKVLLVGTGGYSKSYVLGSKQGNVARGHYSEKGMMSPVVLGSPIIHVTPRLVHGDGSLDYTVEALGSRRECR